MTERRGSIVIFRVSSFFSPLFGYSTSFPFRYLPFFIHVARHVLYDTHRSLCIFSSVRSYFFCVCLSVQYFVARLVFVFRLVRICLGSQGGRNWVARFCL
ncbi:hypothetical protein V8F20_004818 [Naviculisporaceae sp. PSN 640]